MKDCDMLQTQFARQFVAEDVVLDSFEKAKPYFDELLERDISDREALEKWLLDASELASCLGEIRTDRYVKMTCHTDDTDLLNSYLEFVEKVEPKCRPLWHKINVKYTESPACKELDPGRYFVMDRSTRASVELFREENVPLLTEQAKLAQQYQQVCGAMTVEFDGRERTLQEMAVYGEDTDRSVRQDAWEKSARRRLDDREQIEDVFDKMFELRKQMASNAGLPDFRAYAFKAFQRFDYGPEACLEFHDAIERAALPVIRGMNEKKCKSLGVEKLRPWDLAVDEKGRPRLKPFETVEELCDACVEIFRRVDPELGEQFAYMKGNGYLGLDSRKGKAPGGYQATYDEVRHPFIFMNAVGLHGDLRTLLHEGGHSFHAYASRDDALLEYRSAPIEFSEVASMAMEMLAMEHYDVIYSGEELVRAKRVQLEHVIRFFPWMAIIDGFQHWLYTHPDHGREERRDYWVSLQERFSTGVDYSGYEDEKAYAWQRQLHLFEVPFYYVEYGIAQLGALQVWQNAKQNRADAIGKYRKALSLGGTRPLPELFEAAGAKFDFSYRTLAPLFDAVQAELAELGD